MRHRQLIGILAGAITISSQVFPASSLEDRPRSVLYISADPGCYSATFASSSTVPIRTPKKLYPVSCFEKHHFEVFWSGQTATQPGNPIPESTASLKFCSDRSKKVKVLGRNSNSYNYGPNEMTGTGIWLPDKGPEAKRYPKRLVCYVGLSTNEFRYFKEISQPLLKGLR
jgi:hypothetical protein